MNWQKELKRIVKGRVKLNEPLSRHTTFKIGGKAECWFEPKDIGDLKSVLNFARRNSLPVFTIGAGSNLLVKDKGIKGIVISLNQPFFKKVEAVRGGIKVGAGLGLDSLVNITQKKGLSGAEFLAGIPGTVGGALLMNAGVRGNCIGINRYLNISDTGESVEVMNYVGKKLTLKKKDLKFSYRFSNLGSYIILAVKLKLGKADKDKIKNTIEKFRQYKKLYQQWDKPNAGCIFRNPQLVPGYLPLTAGQMIDLCGLKGLKRGGAVVSLHHANFILNSGEAKARDVLELMKIVQQRVRQKFRLELVPEIKIVGC